MIRTTIWRWGTLFSLFTIGLNRLTGREYRPSTANLTQTTLRRRVLQGDSAAFEALMLRHRADVESFVRRRLAGDATDDVVQETIIAAWAHWDTFQKERSFKLWILGIARNKLRDHWRRRETPLLEMSYEASYLPADFGRVEVREQLATAWNRLEPDMREVLDLYFSQDLTLAEIARFLDLNLNTVKYRFYRAQAVLAEHLVASETISEGTGEPSRMAPSSKPKNKAAVSRNGGDHDRNKV